MTVYRYGKEDSTNETAISIWMDRKKLDITTQPKVFDIKDNNQVVVTYLQGEAMQLLLCNDVAGSGPEPIEISATSGYVTVNIVGEMPTEEMCSPYRIDLTLKDIVFLNSSTTMTLKEMEFKNVEVGTCGP